MSARRITSIVTCALILVARHAHAATLETFTLAAGGFATGPTGCGSFAAPAPIASYFGSLGIFIPGGGLAPCSIQGGLNDQFLPTGPLTESRGLLASWGANSANDTTRVRAEYGALESESHTLFTGSFSGLNVAGAEGAAWFSDALTFTSATVATGQTGSLVVRFRATGNLSTTGNSTSDVETGWSVNNAVPVRLFRAEVTGSTQNPFVVTPSGTSLANLTLSPGSLTGSVEFVTQPIPIVLGTPLTVRLGLLTFALPTFGAKIDAHWNLLVSGLTLTRAGGAPIADFTVSTASGASYGPTGVLGVGTSPSAATGRMRVLRNPSYSSARIEYRLPDSSPGELVIADLSGRVVSRMTLTPASGVPHSVAWDGRAGDGARAPAGVYFARLDWRGGSTSERFVLLR